MKLFYDWNNIEDSPVYALLELKPIGSSDGRSSRAYAINDYVSIPKSRFSTEGGALYPVYGDDNRSAEQYVISAAAKNKKLTASTMVICAALILVCAAVIAAGVLMGFIPALSDPERKVPVPLIIIAGVIGLSPIVLLLAFGIISMRNAMKKRIRVKGSDFIRVVTYRFRVSEKFGQTFRYRSQREHTVTCHGSFIRFGENVLSVRPEQYDEINVGDDITCTVAEYGERIFFIKYGVLKS